jgi:hypothetical protein
MNAPALTIGPTRHGWAVYLTNGHELARFNGPAAKWRALRYLAHITRSGTAADRDVASAAGHSLTIVRERGTRVRRSCPSSVGAGSRRLSCTR